MLNIGDVNVVRSPVNPKNGGYTWTITFLRDAPKTKTGLSGFYANKDLTERFGIQSLQCTG